jgi:soluble lytic murein transglycosylase-like protein
LAVLAALSATPAAAQGAPVHATPASRGAPVKTAGLPYQRLINRIADRHQIDRHLLTALVEVESARQANAVSPKGARGLGQLMPATARRFGVVDPHDPEDNLEGAAQYLRLLIARYGGDLALALAAYNAGEGAVDKYGTIPPYPETVGYVRKVLERAGLDGRAPQRPDGPEPVRVRTNDRGLILLTNVP